MRIHAVAIILLYCLHVSAASTAPGLSLQAFVGDLGEQKFITLRGDLVEISGNGETTEWQCQLSTEAGKPWAITFHATSVTERARVRWSYRIVNEQPNTTVCSVTFPIVKGIRLGHSWSDNRILWPSRYVGALIDDLTSPDAFEAQARAACKNVPYLHGMYQGDLCLPFFVQLCKTDCFGVMVLDPTHEVISLDGARHETGMQYQVTTHPRIPTGKSWSFAEVEVFQSNEADWHAVAERYREWLIAQGFRPRTPRQGDVAALMYGRWDGLRPAEVIRWAKALDIKDVCLWVVLYGRGDQYYPCYFPTLEVGVEGMAEKLKQLRAAGLSPYFYTNGYLLSPLQTKAAVKEWTEKYPKKYPGWLAKGDKGYAQTAAKFRALGHEFAGEWIETSGGILPLRVRRVSFRWGEFPLYFWHQRPFWAACVASQQWRKLFRDTACLHAQLGARGIFIDQVAAIHPELCAANGHGHDNGSFGLWNRAYLRLLQETKQAGATIGPGFFIEAEGASDLYAKYIDRYLCYFGKRTVNERRWPRLLRYTVPWTRFDWGLYGYDDPREMAEHVERTLLMGCIFRAGGGSATGEEDPHDPRLTSEAAQLLKAGIQMRRKLTDFMDNGRYMDDVGLKGAGCSAVRWFDSESGVLIAAQAEEMESHVSLSVKRDLRLERAEILHWKTGANSVAHVRREKNTLVARGLTRGLNLIVIPAR